MNTPAHGPRAFLVGEEKRHDGLNARNRLGEIKSHLVEMGVEIRSDHIGDESVNTGALSLLVECTKINCFKPELHALFIQEDPLQEFDVSFPLSHFNAGVAEREASTDLDIACQLEQILIRPDCRLPELDPGAAVACIERHGPFAGLGEDLVDKYGPNERVVE